MLIPESRGRQNGLKICIGISNYWPFQIGEELLFLKAVALCHTVQISYDQPDCIISGGDPFSQVNGFSTNHMEYYASSPDEKALVEAAKR